VTVNGASDEYFETVEATPTSARVVVPSATVNADVILVGALYCALEACCAVIVVDPALTRVTSPVLEPTVATPESLLVYVTAPLLALLATTLNDVSTPYVLDSVAAIAVLASVVVPSATVSVLLVFVAVEYSLVVACVAVNVTVPALTRVITPVLASIVATSVALLVYVIAPLLALVGTVAMLNDASPYVLDAATANVDNTGINMMGSVSAIPLLLIPSPPYIM
jgi:hypothetical protein